MKKYDPEEYRRNRDKYMARQKAYRTRPENRERYLEKARLHSKRWYSENKERRYAYNKEWWKKRVLELEGIAGRKRPEKCEICSRKEVPHFDHCHKTGKFRGWICKRCNTVLGKVEDDIILLDSLKHYLMSAVTK